MKLLAKIIVFAAIAASVFFVGEEALWGDEYHTIRVVDSESYADVISALEEDIHPPAYFTLMYYWTKIAGISELSLRLPSIIFGFLSILLLAGIAEKAYSKKTAEIAAVLFASSGILAVYMLEARMYALLILLFLLQLKYFYEYIKKKDAQSLVLFSLFSFFSISAHVTSILPWVLFNFVFFVLESKVILIKKWAFSQLLVLAAYGYWIPAIAKQAIIHYPTVIELINSKFGHAFDFSYVVNAGTGLAAGVILIPASVLVIMKFRKEILNAFHSANRAWIMLPDFSIAGIIVLIIVIQIAFFGFFFSTNPFIRYGIWILPLAVIFISARISAIKSKKIKYAVIFCVLIFHIATLSYSYTHINRFDWKSAVDYSKMQAAKGNFVVGFDRGGTSFDLFNYYYKEKYESIRHNTFRISRQKSNIMSSNLSEFVSPEDFEIKGKGKYKILVITKLKGKSSEARELLDSKYEVSGRVCFKDIEIIVYGRLPKVI